MNQSLELQDKDGDGILMISFNNRHAGVELHIMDMFGNEVIGEFYKTDLIEYFETVIKSLKVE